MTARPSSTPPLAEALPFDLAGCLDRVRRRDQVAAREMVEHLYPNVIRIVRGHLPRRVAEEDLSQEIFLKMFTRLDQYRGAVPFSHWVSRIAVTTCIDHLRAQKLRPEYRWADLSERQAEVLHSVMADENAVPAGDALAAHELVQTLLQQLPPEDRLILRLRELEQKSFAEITQITGWNNVVAKVRACRARRRLHRLFGALQEKERPRRTPLRACASAG